ncbi:MAG: hypothetical protein CVU72_01070 [Deltaproteobacteria bacterium HGW-Deltaproteobacteria-7]|nr:MAG: hypothetical protein CVU72_01070 [Deltaproteobacteria bacterium HGW-Deltaproteobacteria-7]PKN17189.1 MAG: hypothetical protein CVU71_16785 [Deltaproteobacteria bacterium HGW-Deltaproteobacteria-6]
MKHRCKKNEKRSIALFTLFVFFLVMLPGCSSNPESNRILPGPAQMNAPGYSIGVPQGSAAMTVVEQKFPKCKIEYYSGVNDGYLAVKQGKIDAFAFDRHTLQYVAMKNPDLALMDDKIADERIVAGAALDRKDLITKVNAFIRQYKADGTYQEMYNRWILQANAVMPRIAEPENPAMTLKIATDGLNEPMNFYAGGELTGFDIEFVKRLAYFLNAKVTYQTMEFSALVIAAQAGKVDLLIADLNATPERRKKMLFSDAYMDSEVAFLVRKDRLSRSAAVQQITDVSQLAGGKVGVQTGTTYETVLKDKLPDATPVYFTTFTDQIAAVKAGKIAGFLVDEVVARGMIRQTSGITYIPKWLRLNEYAFAFSKNQSLLHREVNAALQEIKNDGTLKKLETKWFGTDDTLKVLPALPLEGKKRVIRFATNSDCAPFVYMKNGTLVGYDIEVAMIIASKLGRKLEIMDMDFAAIIPSLSAGKSDMAGAFIAITEERAQSVLFSIPNYSGGTVAVVAELAAAPASQIITDPSQLAGKKVGIITGSVYDGMLKKYVPGAVPEYFNSFSDETEALKTGKIAAFLVDEPIARDIINHSSGVISLTKALSSDSYAFVFPKNQVDLQKQVNAVLKEMQGNGTLKKIEARWFGKDDSAKVLPDLRFDGKNGVIHLATNSNLAPFAYVKHGKIVGYDIEIAMIIASKLGRTLEIADMDVAAVIPSLMSGKSDMAVGGFTVTKERARSVLFSVPNYTGGIVVMVAAGADARENAGGKSIWAGLGKSFQRTFMVEDRYKLVLQGLWVTILISILSAVLGTVLGFIVCMMRRAKTRVANIPARVFIRAIQGTPIVVLLMILYYIVFGSMDINAIVVAIIGFSINFAAYVSEMMRTGIDAVDKGQHEAAYAIGFNRIQVFARITLPQAAKHVLPVFKGEFISMLKMTSVVGYIAIQDLTKISDIIRSRTYEAFFPLIATALIYFTIAYVMAFLLSRVEMRIDPKWRKRVVKGVVIR